MKRSVFSLAAALTLGIGNLLALPAEASTSGADAWLQLVRDPNQFYLFDDSSVKQLSYEQPREFRVCAKTKTVGSALEVTHDDTHSVVAPGDCISFEAKKVEIRAQQQPNADWNLVGTVKERIAAN